PCCRPNSRSRIGSHRRAASPRELAMLNVIDELFRAMEWSDSGMWSALRSAPAAANDASVRDKVHHLHMVQYSFLSIWRGNPTRPPALDSFADTLAMESWARALHPE